MQSLCLKDPQSCPSVCVCVCGGVCSELRYGGPGGSGAGAGGGGILELVTT